MKLKIDITVSDIKVDEGYYNFNWSYSLNGKNKKTGHYSNDYDGQTAEHFKKVLENGHAFEIVLDQIIIP
jgi:hypothetical protein